MRDLLYNHFQLYQSHLIKLKDFYLSLKNIDIKSINNIDRIKEKKIILDKKLLKITNSINNLNKKIIIKKNEYIEEINSEKIIINYNNYIKKKDTFEKYKLILKNNNDCLNKMDEKIKKLSKHKYDPNCKFCINNIFVKDAINTKGDYMNNLKIPKKTLNNQKRNFVVSDYQKSERDFAFVVSKDVSSQDLINAISVVDNKLISNIRVFDVYEGENIPENQKSIAISITIQSYEKTLNDNDLDKINKLIIETVENKTGAKIRS